MSALVWVICPLCGAASLGAPPHGQQGQPCPTSEREQKRRDEANEAYIAKLNAERASAESLAFAGLDASGLTAMVAKMITPEEES